MTDYYDEASKAAGQTVNSGLGGNLFKQYEAPKVANSILPADWKTSYQKTDYSPNLDAIDTFKSKQLTLGGGDTSTGFGFGVDGESLQGYAQLGGLAMQLLGYSDKKKHMKAQTAGLKQNIAQQATDNAFKASTIANLGGAPKPIKAQTGMA